MAEEIERFRCVDAEGSAWVVTSRRLLRVTAEGKLVDAVPLEAIQWTKVHRTLFRRGARATVEVHHTLRQPRLVRWRQTYEGSLRVVIKKRREARALEQALTQARRAYGRAPGRAP
jgi:hypothetical protein